jgi:hypothetical protein
VNDHDDRASVYDHGVHVRACVCVRVRGVHVSVRCQRGDGGRGRGLLKLCGDELW